MKPELPGSVQENVTQNNTSFYPNVMQMLTEFPHNQQKKMQSNVRFHSLLSRI